MPFRSRLAKPLLIVGVLFNVLAAAAFAAEERLCQQPVDVSSTVPLPGWLKSTVKRDEVAYPFHATLGATLSRLSCQPLATGVQWFKAAAHARSAADVDQAAQGLSDAREHGESSGDWAADLCRSLANGRQGEQQAAVLTKAGIQCPTLTAR